MKEEKIRKSIREGYGKIASFESSCLESSSSCCGSSVAVLDLSKKIGYTEEEIRVVPTGANLGLGCGNPVALASLNEGETVLDLGSGAGIDCFLAAKKVGEKGKVIGVDMTPEMIEKARGNAQKSGIENVEFRLGEIENLPVEDSSVDVVISNCVINLSANKKRVFEEVRRVLKTGGRVAISDIALLKELPKKVRESIEAYVGCVAGAVPVDEYKRIVKASGLRDVETTIKGTSNCIGPDTNDPLGRALLDNLKENETPEEYIVSVYVEGKK